MDAATTELLKSGIIGAFLVLVIMGGVTRKFVFGWVYEEMKEDRDYWRNQAEKATDALLKGASIAETAAALAEKTAGMVRRGR